MFKDLTDVNLIIIYYLSPEDLNNYQVISKYANSLIQKYKKFYLISYSRSLHFEPYFYYRSVSLLQKTRCISFLYEIYSNNRWQNIVKHLNEYQLKNKIKYDIENEIEILTNVKVI